MVENTTDAMTNLVTRYRQRLAGQLGVLETEAQNKPQFSSKEYLEFKHAFVPTHYSLYEKLCSASEKLLKITPDKAKEEEINESVAITHLKVTPVGVSSFAFIAPLVMMIITALFSLFVVKSMFFVLFFLITGVFLIKPLGRIPFFLANAWRLKASNQMVICIFYIVTYMRHTSNLELAIKFASDHTSPPLSLDLRKVVWDVETQKYSTVKESLEVYLETWRKWNIEFIESFHLIESSLLEGDNEKRVATLDRSLDVILTETYERMLHYAQNLKSPVTMLHMLGIILPILGLVILPLVVSFLQDVKWYSIALLYNVALPLIVSYFGKNILAKRPTGYGDTDISEIEEYKKYSNFSIKLGSKEMILSPAFIATTLFIVLFIIGFSPPILHYFIQDEAGIGFGSLDESSTCLKSFCLLDYRQSASGQLVGPFGLGASLLSLLITLSFGLSLGIYFRLRSRKVIDIRRKTEELEQEFSSGIFQLGNRLGDGTPAESSFDKVGRSMQGTISGNFFSLVGMNIRRLGMSVSQAIFDPKQGALLFFPSKLIESSMKVLVESVKKGPKTASTALINISRYVKEIHKVNERLKDLMAEILSSMHSQIKFLTPVIAGIVIGITSMVSSILGKLALQMKKISAGEDVAAIGGGIGPDFFGQGVPTFHFQIIVGLYVVQITYILTILANAIQNGSDKLNERYELGQNMIRASVLYCIVSAAIMITFNFIASRILSVSLLGA